MRTSHATSFAPASSHGRSSLVVNGPDVNGTELLAELTAHCVAQIADRTNGLDRDEAWDMWDGDPDLVTVTRNPGLWAQDLVAQLTGAVAWKTGFRQGAGGVAITRRHILWCAHWDVEFVGLTVRFINTTGGGTAGEYFQTTIIATSPIDDTPATINGLTLDLKVGLLAAELPAWVNIFSVYVLDAAILRVLPTSAQSSTAPAPVLPLVCISQGETDPHPDWVQKLYVNNAFFHALPNTISGSGDFNKRNSHPDIYPYWYDSSLGDSGSPVFLLVNDVLYLSHILVGLNFALVPLWNLGAVNVINELIRRADAIAGVSTGLQIAVA